MLLEMLFNEAGFNSINHMLIFNLSNSLKLQNSSTLYYYILIQNMCIRSAMKLLFKNIIVSIKQLTI